MQTQSNAPVNILLLGGVILDRYFVVDRYPQAGGDALIQQSFDRVGGCCLNVAMTLKNLGAVPSIVNQLGNDEIGNKIEEYIGSQGLSTELMRRASGRPSGYCLSILDRSGERTFFTFKGCEEEFNRKSFAPGALEGFPFVYITGYYLINRQTAAAVLRLAHELRQDGCQILFDPGPLVGELDPDQLKGMLASADWILPNAKELEIIQEKLSLGDQIIERLLNGGVQGVVLKKGSQGVEVFTPTRRFTVNSLPVTVKDTTGAGDSFAGGLIYGLANGYALAEAVALANACGALTSTMVGPHGAFSLKDY